MREFEPIYVPDHLICPQCLTIQDAPFDIGDSCLCGGSFVDGKAVRDWKVVFDLTGKIVAHARTHQDKGHHHLSVYGAIGKCLIDREEFNEHYERLLNQKESLGDDDA